MDQKTIRNLRRFKEALESNGIRVKHMIVYGSCAHGNAATHSDIDVAIISDSFKRLNLLSRLEVLGSVLARARIMAPIDALGYTEREFRTQARGTFLHDEIRARGKIVRL